MTDILSNCVMQRTLTGTETDTGTGTETCPTVVKVESGVAALTSTQQAELHFLRSRVRELEREKAEVSAENQRLRNMLVHEIPGLLSTMWQMLGQINSNHSPQPTAISSSAPAGGDSYAPYHHHNHHSATNQDRDFSPQVQQPDLNVDLSGSWPPLGSDDEEAHCAELVLDDPRGAEPELCGQTNMVDLRRSCSDGQCPDVPGQASPVEVYPGSGVLCDIRWWQAANQAQSPTAMARTLLLGVFDMNTLMNSNLRGGRSRRPAFHPQRSALDPHKINAIFNAILARFPLAKKGVIGSGINSKLSEIRFRSRRANRDAQFL